MFRLRNRAAAAKTHFFQQSLSTYKDRGKTLKVLKYVMTSRIFSGFIHISILKEFI